MYTILIATAVFAALLAALTFTRKVPEDDTRVAMVRRNAITGAIMGFLAGCLIAGKFVRESIPMKENVIANIGLAAMRSQEATAGTFIFGTGSISQQKIYQFYIRHGDGSVSPQQILADETIRIMEDPDLKDRGTLTIYERERDPASPRNAWAILQFDDKRVSRSVFRVPVGTVLVNFKVD